MERTSCCTSLIRAVCCRVTRRPFSMLGQESAGGRMLRMRVVWAEFVQSGHGDFSRVWV